MPEHLGLPNEEIAVTQEPETPRRAKPPTAKSIRTPLILVGVLGGVFLLCCGGFGVMAFFGSRIGKATQTNLAEADALWDKGDKAGATAKYRKIIDDHRASFVKEDRARVYGRVIDSEFEGGNADAGKKLLDDAFKRDVTPAVSHPEAKKVIGARASAETKKKEVTRRASLSPIDQLKEAKWDDLVPVGSLHREFNGNLVAAEEMYKGKTIMVEGEVESVDRSGFGSVQIYLSYRHGQRGVRCAVSSVGAKSEDLKNLQPGSWVRVHGHCEGKAPSGIVNMTDCIFMLVNR